jgi:hypothetical protein
LFNIPVPRAALPVSVLGDQAGPLSFTILSRLPLRGGATPSALRLHTICRGETPAAKASKMRFTMAASEGEIC